MPIEIKDAFFVGPKDAFQIAGEEAYGPNWQSKWITDLQAPECKLVLQTLRAALKSGQVTAHWSTMDFRSFGDLSPQEADREFFSIDLVKDCIFHHSMNEPVLCRIHADQLRGFVRRQGRRTVPTRQHATDRCREWLVKEFSNKAYSPPKVADHMRLAKELFPNLSDSGYKQARKAAIQVTGRTDLTKAGAKKSK